MLHKRKSSRRGPFTCWVPYEKQLTVTVTFFLRIVEEDVNSIVIYDALPVTSWLTSQISIIFLTGQIKLVLLTEYQA